MIARCPTRLIISLAFLMVAIAYLLEIASPRRLINDGVDYRLQASSALDGNGLLLHGVCSIRPSGSPALIWVLAKAGIGESWAIVALNWLLLGVGVWRVTLWCAIHLDFRLRSHNSSRY